MAAVTDSIETLGHPLGFKVADGADSPLLDTGKGRDVIRVEARQLEGHQKEAVVTEGVGGHRWRVTTDEDGHLRGTDLAPFPLGFYNAGLHGDLLLRLRQLAALDGLRIDEMTLHLNTGYYMTGSFFSGTGQGFAEPADIELTVSSSASDEELQQWVAAAIDASPALASMRLPMANTFAIYVNGRRRQVTTMAPSPVSDVADPFVVHQSAPTPMAETGTQVASDLIHKTGRKTEGVPVVAPGDMKTPQIRPVIGVSNLVNDAGLAEVDVVLGMPGASHFALNADCGTGGMAPSGLALLSAGVGFCYMTQLSRYIQYQKMAIRGVRLVQDIPFIIDSDNERMAGRLEPADTHLFLSGDEDDETFERLMRIAERTCYLHATMATNLEPRVVVRRKAS